MVDTANSKKKKKKKKKPKPVCFIQNQYLTN